VKIPGLAYLEAHRTPALIAGAVGVGGFALYRKSHPSATAAASTTSGSTLATPTTNTSAVPASSGSYDNSSIDNQNGLQSEITSLGNQISALATPAAATTPTTAASTAPTAPDYSSEYLSGTGYALPAGTNSIVGLNGTTYSVVPNVSAAASILAAGGTLYDQPTQGNFLAAPPGGTPGTVTATPTQLFMANT
jgi:hypothetical protein